MSTPAIKFSPDELAAFREEYCKGATDAQFTLFITECERRNLIPGQHIVFQLRSSKEWNPDINASINVRKAVKITTIDALRLISQRTGEYEGQGEGEFYYLDEKNEPTIVSKIPLPHPTLPNTPREPWAATIPIYRKGFREPVRVMARFDAYAVLRKGRNGDMVLSDVWARRAPEMLLKCAESGARRAAFPSELAGLYISEEFDRQDAENAPPPVETPAQPVAEAPKAVSVPTVNHAPATATNDPRPQEKVTGDNPAIRFAEEVPGVKSRTKKLAKETTIEDVVLDKVEVVTEPEPEIAPEPTPSVQNLDKPKASSADRLRALISGGIHKDNLRDYCLKTSGKSDTKTLLGDEWDKILTPLETLLVGEGKEAVNKFIVQTPPPQNN